MTPFVAIALITKLKLIFETDADGKKRPDKFLAFQNGSFPVSKENFYFIEPDKYQVDPIDTALKMMDFSKTFNFITEVDDFISPTADELEDVYYETLEAAIPANSPRSTEEEKRYNTAKDFLYQTIETPDGQTITCLANYDHFETQYKEVLSELKARELEAVNAQGDNAAKIKATWERDKPDLKKAIAMALLNWETLGKRTEVEKYLGDFLSLSGSSPSKTIADLKQEYELFTKATTVDHLANELRYTPTYFTPTNFFDDKVCWQSMTLDKAEVKSLVEQAPKRLKDLFSIDTQGIDMTKVSFEYIVVEFVRGWLHYKDFLMQHFWKLADKKTPLSDGTGKGTLPAFADKMIFVRNLRIEAPRRSQTTTNQEHLTAQLFLKLKPQVALNLQKNTTTIRNRKVDHRMAKKVMENNRSLISPKIFLTHMTTLPVIKTSAPGNKKPEAAKKTITATMKTGQPMLIHPMLYKANLTTLFRKPLKPVLKTPVLHTAPATTSSEGNATEVTEHKGMELLAFICRKVPKCPAPDPELTWV